MRRVGSLLSVLLVAGMVAAEVEIPEPASPLVVVFKAGTYYRVRTFDVQEHAVLYTELGGSLMSAPRAIVDVEASQAVNAALLAFVTWCNDRTGAPPGMKLENRPADVYQAVAHHHDRQCLVDLSAALERHRRETARAASAAARPTAATVVDDGDMPQRETVIHVKKADSTAGPTGITNTTLLETLVGVGAEQVIRDECDAEWPTDYSMQLYCRRQQSKGHGALVDRLPHDMPLDLFAELRNRCAAEWPTDYSMRDYCERKQIDAWRALQRDQE